jgi:hypothetical protein
MPDAGAPPTACEWQAYRKAVVPLAARLIGDQQQAYAGTVDSRISKFGQWCSI